jgi:DUF4097 and DUF4098 domain-containing protein YvlB
MLRIHSRLTAVLLPLLWLNACAEIDFGPSDRYKEDFHYSYALPEGGRFSVESSNGSIEISTWEKNEVEVNGTKYAASSEALRDIRIDVMPTSGAVSVRTVTPSAWHGNMGARYVIRVPKHVTLDRVVSSNGSVHVQDVEGSVRLRTSNGSVHTARTKGDLDIQTSNGAVEASHTGPLQIRTSNGSITADLRDPGPNEPVRLESSNGRIELTSNAAIPVRASTSNSSITLRLPASANARVRAHTSNASITTDFDVMTHSGTQSKHSLEGNIGNGGPLLDLTTSNGSIKILKL